MPRGKSADAGKARMQFIVDHLKRSPNAAYAEIASAAKAKGHKIFPIMFGRAKKLLGLVGGGGRTERAKPAGRKPGRKAAPAAAKSVAQGAEPKRRGRPPGPKRMAELAREAAAVKGSIVVPVNGEGDLDAWRSLITGANAGRRLALQYDGAEWSILFG
jgi:hypothetical protein